MVILVLAASGRYRSDTTGIMPSGDLSGPGLSVLTSAESAAERLVLSRGASPLIHLLDCGMEIHRAGSASTYTSTFLTLRYTEAMYTLLTHRLRENLRKACLQYLLEEVGHEVHDLEACRELGVSASEIACFAPLPFRGLPGRAWCDCRARSGRILLGSFCG